ncbi:matrixin family metalloprotease [Brevibacillus sp. RS1.1]|uniref:matrixin family metalloprotease n=1 Tax=Brevibacillus sp. RS1.1 TaxID=2738982 RepID=UPI00156A8AA6|nr:matrixin family metalloprotease [Brevibacillus sp. RS1.1]NRR05443.1 matrixin family metalloprotease [Brevibacillus sp. RS1.1]
MSKKRVFSVSVLMFVVIMLLTSVVSAASSHRLHYETDSANWEYNKDGVIKIRYHYTQDGKYDFGTRVAIGAIAWEDMADSPFDFVKASNIDRADMIITSDDYGSVTWIGLASPNRSQKPIKLNEYYKANSPVKGHDFTYECYENVAAHEIGHIHGLDHYDCRDELMLYAHSHVVDPYDGDRQGIYKLY